MLVVHLTTKVTLGSQKGRYPDAPCPLVSSGCLKNPCLLSLRQLSQASKHKQSSSHDSETPRGAGLYASPENQSTVEAMGSLASLNPSKVAQSEGAFGALNSYN